MQFGHKTNIRMTYITKCMFILMHDLPSLTTAPMALMHGHVNEWHSIETKKL